MSTSVTKTALTGMAAFCGAFLSMSAQALPAGLYSNVLSQNTTGFADSTYTGVPDDGFVGIGGQIVTYDFFGSTRIETGQSNQTGNFVVTNGAGQDFNIYEVDFGGPEFGAISVFASIDGIVFVDITASQAAFVNIDGDEMHSSATFAQSYDLGSLTSARFIRIDGDGTGAAGSTSGFDLEAVGAINFAAAAPLAVPEPASFALLALGLVGLGCARRRR